MDTLQYSKGTLLVSEAAGGGLPFPQYPADTQVLKEPALVSEAKAFHFRHRHCLSQSLPNRVVTLNGRRCAWPWLSWVPVSLGRMYEVGTATFYFIEPESSWDLERLNLWHDCHGVRCLALVTQLWTLETWSELYSVWQVGVELRPRGQRSFLLQPLPKVNQPDKLYKPRGRGRWGFPPWRELEVILLPHALRECRASGIASRWLQAVFSLVFQVSVCPRFFWFLFFILTVYQNAMSQLLANF